MNAVGGLFQSKKATYPSLNKGKDSVNRCTPKQRLKKIFALLTLCIFFLVLIFPNPAFSRSQRELDEYTIKAGLLVKLLSFVEWPYAFADPDNTITIFIIGKSPLEKSLKPISKKVINGQQLKIHILSADTPVEYIRKCHVLFLSSSLHLNTTKTILQSLTHTPVLTVSDTKGFLESGGIINFVPQKRRIGFEINRAAAGRAGLIVRSRLLRLATRIVE